MNANGINTIRDARLLCVLAVKPDLPAKDIYEAVTQMGETLTRGNVGVVLTRLCQRGLLDWTTVDRPENQPGRYTTISLYRPTERGRTALAKWVKRARQVAGRTALATPK